MDSNENRLNNVDFLIKAASLLPSDNYSHKLLKSYYLTKCKKLTQDHNQSKSFLSDEEMCRKCSTPWCDTNYTLSIAKMMATKRKSRKIHKQIEDKYKRKNHLAKKLSKKANNIVSVKCNFCKHKNKVVLWKKSSSNETKQPQPESNQSVVHVHVPNKRTTEPIIDEQQPPSKKKRKKDKTAGLLYAFKTNEKTTEKKLVNLCQQTQYLNIQKEGNTSGQPKKNKANTSKGLNKKSKISVRPDPRRNNLLLLANALKAKNKPSSSSQGDKLKQLLR